MNKFNLALGALMAIILAVMVVAIVALIFPDKNSQQEINSLRAEVIELKSLRKNLLMGEQHRQSPLTQNNSNAASELFSPDSHQTSPAEEQLIAELEAQLQEALDSKEEAEKRANEAEEKQELLNEEANYLTQRKGEEHNKEARRSRLIAQALVQGTVVSYDAEWGFLTIQAKQGQMLSQGTILGIRRKSGILCQVEIEREEAGQYVANLLPNSYAGEVPNIHEGDELIIPPM